MISEDDIPSRFSESVLMIYCLPYFSFPFSIQEAEPLSTTSICMLKEITINTISFVNSSWEIRDDMF
jgi:hypothetical protein